MAQFFIKVNQEIAKGIDIFNHGLVVLLIMYQSNLLTDSEAKVIEKAIKQSDLDRSFLRKRFIALYF